MNVSETTFLTFAAEPWNASGIRFVQGKRYRLEPLKSADHGQEWQDSWISCGPLGWNGSLGKFSSSALSPFLRVKKIGNASPRYFALIGCIGKSLDHAFLIGESFEILV